MSAPADDSSKKRKKSLYSPLKDETEKQHMLSVSHPKRLAQSAGKKQRNECMCGCALRISMLQHALLVCHPQELKCD